MTQQQLALLAGISTPTLSRFENGEEDIQLSSLNKILEALGMLDKRRLIFSEPKETYDWDKSSVRFDGHDGPKIVACYISKGALDDMCGETTLHKGDVITLFKQNRSQIEHVARQKYLANIIENDGTISIGSADFR